jgi:hypothetical protein
MGFGIGSRLGFGLGLGVGFGIGLGVGFYLSAHVEQENDGLRSQLEQLKAADAS